MKTRVKMSWGMQWGIVAVGVALVGCLVGCADPDVIPCASGQFDGENCVIVDCPEGFRAEGDGCVSDTPVDSKAPTTNAVPAAGTYAAEVAVTLSADENATIFYTTNGASPTESSDSGETPVRVNITQTSELKFFARDPAGNLEEVKTVNYTIDASPPAGLSNFVATINASDAAALSWSNPADGDFTGSLVVRSLGGPVTGFTPAAEGTYAVGDYVAPNVQVAYVGTAQNFVDGEARAGANHYAGYARDSTGNFSTAAVADLDAPFENGQQATLEVHLATQQVIVTQQPRDVRIIPSGTAVGGSDATLALDVESRSGQVLTNLKLRVENIEGATPTANATIEGDAAIHYGVALPIGEVSSRDILLSEVGATDPITITMGVYSDPIMVGPGNTGQSGGFKLVDPRSGTIAEVPCDVFGPPTSSNSDRCAFAGLGRSPGGSTIFAGKRNSPHVVAHDPIANTTMTSAALTTTPYAAVVGVAVTPDGNEILALLNEGQHWQSFGPGGQYTSPNYRVHVVRMNAVDLMETGRITLVTRATPITGRGIAIDAGGTFAAVGLWSTDLQRAYRINLNNNQVQFTTLPTADRVNSVAISNDGSLIFVGYRQGSNNMTRWAPGSSPTNVNLPGIGTSPRTGRMIFGPDGRLYINFRRQDPTGVYAYDINMGTFTLLSGQPARASALSPDATKLFTIDDQFPATIRVIDVETQNVISAVQLDTQFSLGRGHFCGEWIEP